MTLVFTTRLISARVSHQAFWVAGERVRAHISKQSRGLSEDASITNQFFFFFRYGCSAKRKEDKYNVPALAFPSSHECSKPCDKLSYCCVWGSSTQCSTYKPQGTVNRLATLTFLLHAVATLMNARSTILQGLWKLFLVSLKASGIAALLSFILGLYAPGHKLNARRVQFASGALRALPVRLLYF